eukprot:CAMPEP_0185010914 /NCGR_PEP_ID=MMETSP1098-20130426/96227_1 /TAXON_ID=89044 /ORGANISM="Spumella elongata, Strain CCAP 955/1" /LENGTH=129 /DNA_ID=CAMNT_0027539865 /DNA_START=34 /DNA_END=423 /DNA_ORIENTATION=+
MSLAGYRRLLRRINITFAGDHKAIKQAKIQLKGAFLENKHSTDFETHQKEIDEIDEVLRFHIVQATKSVRGNFGLNLSDDHQVTIAAGQSLQHGPELEAIDPSYVGRTGSLIVEKTKGDRTPFDGNDIK